LPAARRSANGQSDLIGQKGGRSHEPGNALDGSLCEGGGEMVHSTRMRAPACASLQGRRRQRGNACTSAVANAAREAAFAAAINANTHNRRTRERGDAAISAAPRHQCKAHDDGPAATTAWQLRTCASSRSGRNIKSHTHSDALCQPPTNRGLTVSASKAQHSMSDIVAPARQSWRPERSRSCATVRRTAQAPAPAHPRPCCTWLSRNSAHAMARAHTTFAVLRSEPTRVPEERLCVRRAF
jgi:hypothetical protein